MNQRSKSPRYKSDLIPKGWDQYCRCCFLHFFGLRPSATLPISTLNLSFLFSMLCSIGKVVANLVYPDLTMSLFSVKRRIILKVIVER
jgi:hypothetical protein